MNLIPKLDEEEMGIFEGCRIEGLVLKRYRGVNSELFACFFKQIGKARSYDIEIKVTDFELKWRHVYERLNGEFVVSVEKIEMMKAIIYNLRQDESNIVIIDFNQNFQAVFDAVMEHVQQNKLAMTVGAVGARGKLDIGNYGFLASVYKDTDKPCVLLEANAISELLNVDTMSDAKAQDILSWFKKNDMLLIDKLQPNRRTVRHSCLKNGEVFQTQLYAIVLDDATAKACFGRKGVE